MSHFFRKHFLQGKTFGGGTAVNNYAWITPSYLDLKNTLGVTRDEATEAMVKDYENLCEELIGPRQPPHPLHQLLTVHGVHAFMYHTWRCMCACMPRIYIYACMHVFMYVCMHACVPRICMYLCTFTCIYATN